MTNTVNPDPSSNGNEIADDAVARERELRVRANELLNAGKKDEAVELFAEAAAIRKQFRKQGRKWEDRYDLISYRRFSPALTDKENDIGVSSIAVATWELLLNGEIVRVIRAVRFGVNVISEEDARVPQLDGEGGYSIPPAIISEAISPKKEKQMMRGLNRFSDNILGLISKGLDDREVASITAIDKTFPFPGLEGPTSSTAPIDINVNEWGCGPRNVDIEMLLGEQTSSKENIDNLVTAIRGMLFNPRGFKKVGSVRGGESRFKR